VNIRTWRRSTRSARLWSLLRLESLPSRNRRYHFYFAPLSFFFLLFYRDASPPNAELALYSITISIGFSKRNDLRPRIVIAHKLSRKRTHNIDIDQLMTLCLPPTPLRVPRNDSASSCSLLLEASGGANLFTRLCIKFMRDDVQKIPTSSRYVRVERPEEAAKCMRHRKPRRSGPANRSRGAVETFDRSCSRSYVSRLVLIRLR